MVLNKRLLKLSVMLLALGAGAGAYATQPLMSPKEKTYQQLELFASIFGMVKNHYVVETDSEKLIEAALNGMMGSLDPHSSYLVEDDYQELKDTTKGSYGGLGIEVTGEDGAIKIITPMDETPASRAGLQSGDFITALDGNSIIGTRLDKAIDQMKGEPGTSIKLTIFRPGKAEPFDVELKRETIQYKSVRSRLEGQYYFIRIARFNEKTFDETRTALTDLKAEALKKNLTIRGLILDLRNNPGGLLTSSVCVSDLFLKGGEIVSQRERDLKKTSRYFAENKQCQAKGDMVEGLPIAILANPGSASAAEIVAGALQDHKRAKIVGLTTFGKGSVQSVVPLDDKHAVKLTTGRYFTPSGRSIQRTGIEPDLEIAQSKEQARYIATVAKQFSEESYANALESAEGRKRRDQHAVQEIPPADFDTIKGDFQLERAKDLLSLGNDVSLAIAKPRGKTYKDEDLLDKPSSRFSPKASAASSSSASSSSSSSGSSSSSATSSTKP
jgi:carboxyl-terminal processing protease